MKNQQHIFSEVILFWTRHMLISHRPSGLSFSYVAYLLMTQTSLSAINGLSSELNSRDCSLVTKRNVTFYLYGNTILHLNMNK